MPLQLNTLKTTLLGVMALLLLIGCSAEKSKWMPAGVSGYNHTSAAINHFSIGPPLGPAGGPNIGPQQGGGKETCCGVLPRQWYPMRVLVEWEKDPNVGDSANWPERMFSDAWHKRMEQHRAKYTQHRAYVDVPPYEEPCTIKVHFLPCDQVRISTTCVAPASPNYPDKEYFNAKEPKECPKT